MCNEFVRVPGETRVVSQQRINICRTHKTPCRVLLIINALLQFTLALCFCLHKLFIKANIYCLLDVPVFYLYLTNAEDTIHIINVWVALERTDCDIIAAVDAIFRSVFRKQMKVGGINHRGTVAALNVVDFSANLTFYYLELFLCEFIGLFAACFLNIVFTSCEKI